MTTLTLMEEPYTEAQQTFAALLESRFQNQFRSGQVVVGEILRIEKEGLIVDIGAKCEGFVPLKEMPLYTTSDALAEKYRIGQITEVYIVKEFDEENPFLLSLRRIDMWRTWETLKGHYENNITLDVKIAATSRGGLIVQYESVKGFMPMSHLRLPNDLESLIGRLIPAKLIEVDRSKNKLIFSHRLAIFESESARRAETLNQLAEGQIIDGTVVKITHFGAFVDINGVDGLLPLSEISWRRLKHPSEILNMGQPVQVKVLAVDRDQERISLTLKRLDEDPWDCLTDTIQDGMQTEGPISKLLQTGFLVELLPGVEAFCSYQRMPRNLVNMGDTHLFSVVSVVARDRRITLEPLLQDSTLQVSAS